MLDGLMPSQLTTESAVQRELLQLALHNSLRSVPMLLAAVAVIVLMGLSIDRYSAAVATAALGVPVAVWRFLISKRYANTQALPEAQLRRARRELEGNAGFVGVMWVLSTLNIYPALMGTMGTTYVGVVFGSITIAAFFMTLVGRSFVILAGMQLGALIVVSLFSATARSLPLALLAVIYGLTVLRAAGEFKDATTRAIRHSLEVDLANA